ncbi:MAG TPA: DUF4276 family protein [Gemmataceae bacterium]|nr:DUF4276 family protein [Gemmataceae bacterium]
MTLYIAPIVEGQTEQGCLARLLHRIWAEVLARAERLQVLEPFRGHRDALVHQEGRALTETVQKAFVKLQAKARKDLEGRSLVLILLDAEDDCPARLAPRLLETARMARRDTDIACVLAKRMLENWIVAGSSTLVGANGLPDDLKPPEDIEGLSGAGWLDEQLRSRDRTRKYKKTVDAKEFVQAMDLAGCQRNSPSFDKLCRELCARVQRAPEVQNSTTEAADDRSKPDDEGPADSAP